jgi:hypothetical protein
MGVFACELAGFDLSDTTGLVFLAVFSSGVDGQTDKRGGNEGFPDLANFFYCHVVSISNKC